MGCGGENGVDGADGGAFGGEGVQVGDYGDFVGHGYCGAVEVGGAGEAHEGGHGGGFVEGVGVGEGEVFVDELVDDGGEGVCDGVAEEVAYFALGLGGGWGRHFG